jgi:hypothetical protein
MENVALSAKIHTPVAVGPDPYMDFRGILMMIRI